MALVIRPIDPNEAGLYREIRLEALRLHPEAFGSAFEQEQQQPLTHFAARLTTSTIFGGFQDDVCFGTAGFMPETGLKRAHKAQLWGVYVRAAARGTGLARELVRAVLDHAQDRVEVLQLSVVAGNATARRLYESHGFEVYGLEARSLKVEGRYLDEFHMVKFLD